MTWTIDNAQALVAVVIGTAVVLASLRTLLDARRLPPEARPRRWRTAALVALHAAMGGLLYFGLVPPPRPAEAGTLVVLTAGATRGSSAPAKGEFTVALPEARATGSTERAPDVATALRRHPGTQRIVVLGSGFEPRDLDAVGDRGVRFDPPRLPRGLVELWTSPRVQPGQSFVVRGRVAGVRPGTVALLDPAGRPLAEAAVADDGGFTLQARVRTAGDANFSLRIRGADRRDVEVTELQVRIEADAPRRLLVLAGAPGPELKFLRRWALDAGVSLHQRIELGGGATIDDGRVEFSLRGLADFDVLVLDERAWATLGEGRHAVLRAAVADGLGVFLRIAGPMPSREIARLRGLGMDVVPARLASSVELSDPLAAVARTGRSITGDPGAPGDQGGSTGTPPALSREPYRIGAADGRVLLRGKDGTALTVWRAEGRGRIAVSTLADTFRWPLAGYGPSHAQLWSTALATVARASGVAAPTSDGPAFAGSRVVLCDVRPGDRIIAPGGATTVLRPVASHFGACAGYWPRREGLHRITNDTARAIDWPLHVRAAGALPGVRARARREATLALATTRPGARAPRVFTPGARWPWLLAWLAIAGVAWWLERSRVGRR